MQPPMTELMQACARYASVDDPIPQRSRPSASAR